MEPPPPFPAHQLRAPDDPGNRHRPPFGREKKHLAFTWFVQTVVFVLFNKVCTSQYFLWYLLLLPLILPQLSISRGYVASYIIVWVGVQALWLSEAYKLEFLGEQVFLGLWARSLVYVIGNWLGASRRYDGV